MRVAVAMDIERYIVTASFTVLKRQFLFCNLLAPEWRLNKNKHNNILEGTDMRARSSSVGSSNSSLLSVVKTREALLILRDSRRWLNA